MELSYAAICFDLFGTLISDEGSAIAGARETLAGLGAARWAIVTSMPRRAAAAVITRAGLLVPPVLVSADDVLHGKPSPDPYRLAAERLAIEPSSALAVEDSSSGVDSARAAGMDALFILRGRSASACSRADYYVDRFAQLTVSVDPSGACRVAF
ncbi:MAG TPA: HAD-IA family hydrolase [Candidatus Baltobacteraceae bacterium]|nr:HAD-IA family hydrolase [Candidatus Baltobacteraceae bacterium]